LTDLHVRNASWEAHGEYMVDVDLLPAAKQYVQCAFEDALKTLDELGREADRWEQARLVYALCSMAEGQYRDAAIRLEWRPEREGTGSGTRSLLVSLADLAAQTSPDEVLGRDRSFF
jgi:hypothetical protein